MIVTPDKVPNIGTEACVFYLHLKFWKALLIKNEKLII